MIGEKRRRRSAFVACGAPRTGPSETKLKVLHVIPSISLTDGGPSRAIRTIERALNLQGVEVTTLTTDDDGYARRLALSNRPEGVPGAHRVYSRKWTDFYKFAPGAAIWLHRHVRQFDVVHIHALFSFLSVAAARLAKSQRVPYVVRPLGTLASYGLTQRRPLLKKLSLGMVEGPILRNAAAVQFTSQAERQDIDALGFTVRGVVIPLGLEQPPEWHPSDLVREYPILQWRNVILFLSRLHPKKNVEGLLTAFAMLRKQYDNVALLIAGDGLPDYRAALEAQARLEGIGDDVVWLGHIENERKAAALALADVFVLASHSENFGIAAVEAMLAGIPCILAEGVALAGDVEAAGAGITVSTHPESIFQALNRLIADDRQRIMMGECAEHFARSEYSSDVMAQRLVDLYVDLVRVHSSSNELTQRG